MPTNLVALISGLLTPDLVGRIATHLGLDRRLAEKALSGGVPALLASLLATVGRPGGEERLADAVAQQQPGTLTGLANMLGGSGTAAMEGGTNMLSSLLGGNTLSALTSAIETYAGTRGGATKGILGILAPLVLGGIQQLQRTTGTSAADVLSSQRDNIVRALPTSLADTLKSSGLMPGAVSTPPTHAARRSETSPLSWLLPALLALVALAIAWQLLSRTAPTVTAPKDAVVPSPTVPESAAPSLASLRGIKVGDADVGAMTSEAVNGVVSLLKGVTDDGTAQAALPELTKHSTALQTVMSLIGQLSPENRKLIASAIASIKPTLDQLTDRVMALPGVAPILKPAVDAIRAEINSLSAA